MAGAFDSFIRRNLHALYDTSKILLIPSIVLSFVALFSLPKSDSHVKITALLATSVALHRVGFLAILQGPFFFIMRKSGFSAAMGAIFTLVFTAVVISMAAGAILAQKASSSPRALWCTWAMVVVDFINIFVVGVTLGRGSDVDEGMKEMVVPGDKGTFLTTHRGLLYRLMQFFLAASLALSIVSSIYRFSRPPSAYMVYTATALQGFAFVISVAAPFYIPMRKRSITAAISSMLFFTFAAFILCIVVGALDTYETFPEYDFDAYRLAFWFGWTTAISDAIAFVVFFALLRGLVIDQDAEDDEDIAQSNARKRKYNALLHIISQCLLAVSTALPATSIAHFDKLTEYVPIASAGTHGLALFLTFYLPYRLMLRMTNLLVVSAILLTLLLVAFAMLIISGVNWARRMAQYAKVETWGGWCNWIAVVVDVVNLGIMTIPLIRGWKKKDDPGDMEME